VVAEAKAMQSPLEITFEKHFGGALVSLVEIV
jgi:hypothetical protein